jgi:hypothetical protein
MRRIATAAGRRNRYLRLAGATGNAKARPVLNSANHMFGPKLDKTRTSVQREKTRVAWYMTPNPKPTATGPPLTVSLCPVLWFAGSGHLI